jgi:ketosteroid isomerase-like protein
MTSRPVIIALSITAFLFPLFAQRADSPDKAQLEAAEKNWLQAFYRLDSSALEKIEANDFTFIAPAAVVTRDQQLKMVQQRSARAGVPTNPSTFELSNRTVRIYGDVGIISDISTVTGGSDKRIISPGRYWQTQVWRKEGNAWKLIHVHISPVEHGM